MLKDILFWGVSAISLIGILPALWQPGSIFRYPVLFSFTFAGFILVQAWSLRSRDDIPQESFERFLVMALFCYLLVWLGWRQGLRKVVEMRYVYRAGRLKVLGTLLVIGGAFFFQLLSRAEKTSIDGGWTGLPVAYLFMADMLTIGMAILWFDFCREQKIWIALVLCIPLALYADRIFLAGRRSAAIELLLISGLGPWFAKGRAPPRLAVAAVALVATIIFYNIGAVRFAIGSESSTLGGFEKSGGDDSIFGAGAKILSKKYWESVGAVDLSKGMETLKEGRGLEVENAIRIMQAVWDGGSFDFGAFQFDNLIFRFVPAQLFGLDFKSRLYIADGGHSLPIEAIIGKANRQGYIHGKGTTITGLADAYNSFWLFGCLIFFGIAAVMARVYQRALVGDRGAQLWYALLLLSALQALPHHTGYFPARFVYLTVFLLPVLAISRWEIAEDGPFEASPQFSPTSG